MRDTHRSNEHLPNVVRTDSCVKGSKLSLMRFGMCSPVYSACANDQGD